MTMRLARLHHNADELRYVARMLDALNDEHECAGVDPEAKIDIYWADVKMGTIMVPDGAEQFSYFPVAEHMETTDESDAVRDLPTALMGVPGRAQDSEASTGPHE